MFRCVETRQPNTTVLFMSGGNDETAVTYMPRRRVSQYGRLCQFLSNK